MCLSPQEAGEAWRGTWLAVYSRGCCEGKHYCNPDATPQQFAERERGNVL